MPASGITEDKDTGDFFDNIDDLFNFPNEDVEAGFVEDYDSVFQDNEYLETGFVGDGNSSFQGIEEFNDGFAGAFHFSELFGTHMAAPKALEEPLGHDLVACGNDSNQTSDIHNEFSIPYEELWLSNYVADVDSNFTVNDDEITSDNKKEFHNFRASSPVSVLDSSSSCSEEKIKRLSPETIVPGRARSKRPRPANFSPRPVIPLVSPSSSVTESAQPFCVSEESVEFDNFSESCDSPAKKGTKTSVTKIVRQEEKKMKRKNLSIPFGTFNTDKYPSRQPSAIRKCMHCEVTSTPQWRAGPMGPKTLCNACGVRYKSGRLFPEYRPAASPTFVASLHSNSHKKVLEMRTKVGDDITTGTTAIPDLIPNHNHVLNYI